MDPNAPGCATSVLGQFGEPGGCAKSMSESMDRHHPSSMRPAQGRRSESKCTQRSASKPDPWVQGARFVVFPAFSDETCDTCRNPRISHSRSCVKAVGVVSLVVWEAAGVGPTEETTHFRTPLRRLEQQPKTYGRLLVLKSQSQSSDDPVSVRIDRIQMNACGPPELYKPAASGPPGPSKSTNCCPHARSSSSSIPTSFTQKKEVGLLLKQHGKAHHAVYG